MPKCNYCGKDFRTDHNLENHKFLSHRDRARVTWAGEEQTQSEKPAPSPKPAPEPEAEKYNDDDDFWGTD